MLANERKFGIYAALLSALVVFLMLIPAVSQGLLNGGVLRLGLLCIFVAGLFTVTREKPMRRLALPLLVLVVLSEGADYFTEVQGISTTRLGLDAFFLAFTAVAQLHALLQQRRVTADTVFGGINVYLLIACSYMLLHALLEALDPGAYRVGDVSLAQYYIAHGNPSHGFATLIYFSFVTITTLGYGDIVPVSSTAKMLTSSEALVGQIYLATFIARLVALHTAGYGREAAAPSPQTDGIDSARAEGSDP